MDPAQEKLASFVKDSLRVGCLRGFKYFDLYLRGREELVVTVYTTKYGDFDRGFTSPSRLSGSFSAIPDGLPPASPAARDVEMMREDAVFLIGAYARYKCPYVWLRSGHQLLLSLGGGDGDRKDKDFPLKITSTEHWKTKSVKVWDVISELVSISLQPNQPENPFEIDRAFLDDLPSDLERALHAGSLAGFLRRVLCSHLPYSKLVADDLRYLYQTHVMSFADALCGL